MPLPYDPNDPNAQPPPEAPPDQPTPDPGQDPAMPPAVGDQEEGITPASPEEQAAHDHFVAKAWQLIYSDNVFPQVLQMLEGGATAPTGGAAAAAPAPGPPPAEEGAGEATGGAEGAEGDPVQGLATATDMVVARVANAAEQGGEQLQPDVVYHAGADILEELAEISRRAKIKDYSNDADSLERAWFSALDMFRERLQQAGEVDQGDAQGGLDRLVQMDQNGTLDKIMRDLAASDSAGPAGGPEAPTGPNAPKGFKAKGLGSASGAPAPDTGRMQ
jgi:hypothetical protein